MRMGFIIALAGLVLALLTLPGSPSFSQGQGQQGQGRGQAAAPAKPAPRWPDGRPNFGPVAGEAGVWLPGGGASFADPDQPPRGRGGNAPVAGAPKKPKLSEVPFQPWARELYDYRQENEF